MLTGKSVIGMRTIPSFGILYALGLLPTSWGAISLFFSNLTNTFVPAWCSGNFISMYLAFDRSKSPSFQQENAPQPDQVPSVLSAITSPACFEVLIGCTGRSVVVVSCANSSVKTFSINLITTPEEIDRSSRFNSFSLSSTFFLMISAFSL